MGKYCFGVDVGGTTVKLGLFNTNGDLLEKWEIPTVTEDNGKAILPDCAKSILKKMDEREMDRTEVVGVGIGAPGPIDSEGTLYGSQSWLGNHEPEKRAADTFKYAGRSW